MVSRSSFSSQFLLCCIFQEEALPHLFLDQTLLGEGGVFENLQTRVEGEAAVKVTQPYWKWCSLRPCEELTWEICKKQSCIMRDIGWSSDLLPFWAQFLENCPFINQKSQMGNLRSHTKRRMCICGRSKNGWSLSNKCWAFDRHDWSMLSCKF